MSMSIHRLLTNIHSGGISMVEEAVRKRRQGASGNSTFCPILLHQNCSRSLLKSKWYKHTKGWLWVTGQGIEGEGSSSLAFQKGLILFCFLPCAHTTMTVRIKKHHQCLSLQRGSRWSTSHRFYRQPWPFGLRTSVIKEKKWEATPLKKCHKELSLLSRLWAPPCPRKDVIFP